MGSHRKAELRTHTRRALDCERQCQQRCAQDGLSCRLGFSSSCAVFPRLVFVGWPCAAALSCLCNLDRITRRETYPCHIYIYIYIYICIHIHTYKQTCMCIERNRERGRERERGKERDRYSHRESNMGPPDSETGCFFTRLHRRSSCCFIPVMLVVTV